jgi:hypothetical protein
LSARPALAVAIIPLLRFSPKGWAAAVRTGNQSGSPALLLAASAGDLIKDSFRDAAGVQLGDKVITESVRAGIDFSNGRAGYRR